jgi:hypothetical protein
MSVASVGLTSPYNLGSPITLTESSSQVTLSSGATSSLLTGSLTLGAGTWLLIGTVSLCASSTPNLTSQYEQAAYISTNQNINNAVAIINPVGIYPGQASNNILQVTQMSAVVTIPQGSSASYNIYANLTFTGGSFATNSGTGTGTIPCSLTAVKFV